MKTRGFSPCESCIVLLAKPQGITSFSAIASVKKAFYKEDSCKKAARPKVGHTGTLDSFADGLLVVLTGKLTRLAPFIEALPKEYRAEISFGARTDTLDPTGAVVQEAELPNAAALLAALPSFTGKIMQRPPEYSALKQGGKRLSDLARAGEAVSPKAREVTVFNIEPELFASPDGGEAPPQWLPRHKPCRQGGYARALLQGHVHPRIGPRHCRKARLRRASFLFAPPFSRALFA